MAFNIYILFLTDSKNVAQVFKKEKATDWLDIIRVADLNFFILQGLICKVFYVPHVMVKSV